MEHNMMAAQSAGVGEEGNLIDPVEQAALATERAASGMPKARATQEMRARS
jgi:hypothetical protein